MASRSEVYEKFGLAAEAAQLLETELTTILLVLEGLEKNWHLTPAPVEARSFLINLDRQTMGRLIRKLESRPDIDATHTAFLLDAVDARNKLIHGFFERHNFRIQTPNGRDLMLEDLSDLHETLFDAWQNCSFMSDILVNAVKLLKRVETPPDEGAP